jgi:hypothetical protein
MWTFYESYDPTAQILYLDLVSQTAAAPRRDKFAEAKLLESFAEIAVARRFAECYLDALNYEEERVVRRVTCDQYLMDGCRGTGSPCYLGLNDYRCVTRCKP